MVEGLLGPPKSIILMGDSTCTILSVNTANKLKAWMTGKLDEVNRHFEFWRSKGILVEDLHYIQGEQNPADILTRGNVKPEQLQLGSTW